MRFKSCFQFVHLRADLDFHYLVEPEYPESELESGVCVYRYSCITLTTW